MLAPLDWLLIAAYFVFSFAIAVYYYRRAGKDTASFFLTGRNMPWWLAGTSMVATTFAVDTPLAVTELVAQNGIAGNWLWWNFAFGGMLTVFFFARLWRRAGVLTDVEFVELRYSGPAAAWLRGIKAIYFGLLMNCIILGWVSLSMDTIIGVLFPDLTIFGYESFSLLGLHIEASLALVGGLILMVGIYSLLSGLWGVMVTDAFQFVIAIVGSILLAFYVLNAPKVGGMEGLMAQLPDDTFRFLPSIGDAAEGAAVLTLSASAFFAYIGIQWWSSWYPGSEPGGGGYVAQRMMSAKDEKHSLLATLWFTVAHYCLRPWPWIIVALAALILYPDLSDPREGYVLAMREMLPTGVLGLMVAAFLAAFMSTVSTQLNWGVSYLVNDFWRRFVRTDADEDYYVMVSRILTFVVAILAFLVSTQLESISGAWGLALSASAGVGLVLIARWYWWRVNAWSELTATLTPVVLVALVLVGIPVPGLQEPFPNYLYTAVAITTVVWVAATFLTRPTARETLDRFYRRVHPGGPGWDVIAKHHPDVEPDQHMGTQIVNWIVGCLMVYTTLFGVGYILFGQLLAGLGCLAAAGLAAAILYINLKRHGFEKVVEQEPAPPSG